MAERIEEFSSNDEELDRGEQIQRLLYRILPFWPIIILALIVGAIAGRIYLRYQVPIYSARARIIVNDNTEQKTVNLQEIFKIDTRNLSAEAEKEIKILTSRDLMQKLAVKMQLNVIYLQKGRIKTSEYYGNDVPYLLDLQTPDSVRVPISGKVKLLNDSISFNGELYPLDTFVNSSVGFIRWRVNKSFRKVNEIDELQVSILPISFVVALIKNSLSADPISKQSSILDITYSDAIPSRAVDVLNNLISLYGSSAIEYKSRIYENAKRFLDNRLRLVADELSGVEKNIENFKSSKGVIDLSKEGELFLTQVKDADRKIAEIDVQLEVLNQISQYVNKRNNTGDPIPATLGISDPVLMGLLNQLYEAEMELERTRELSGNRNPQIEVLENLITKLKPGITNSIANLKINLTASRSRLKSDSDAMMESLNKIPSKERQLLDITRQQEIKNAIYTFLLQKREESAIAAASIVDNYRVIEKPEGGKLISPLPSKVYTYALMIALLSVVVYIYFKEFASRRILFRTQIEESLPVPIISELVYFEHNPDVSVVVGEGIRTLIAEQFRELRTNLKYITASAPGKCKVILTTSSIPKEGKSFVAINASISLSLTGDRVVLLEFDMRKPKISKPLGINSDTGLSTFLIGNASVPEIIKPHSSIQNLWVIPSGPIPPNPSELLMTGKLEELFSYLKDNFDFVVIDSPPIAAVTDAKILSSMADATIYIIRHNFTNYVFLNLIKDVYYKKSLKNINIVFNGIKNKKILGYGYGGYGQGYGYGYGYNYGYGYTSEDSNKKGVLKRISQFFVRSRR